MGIRLIIQNFRLESIAKKVLFVIICAIIFKEKCNNCAKLLHFLLHHIYRTKRKILNSENKKNQILSSALLFQGRQDKIFLQQYIGV